MRGFSWDPFELIRVLVLPFQLLSAFLWESALLLLPNLPLDPFAVLFLLFQCGEGFRAVGAMRGFFDEPASYGRFRTGCAWGARSGA